MKEIKITDIDGVKIGQAKDEEGATGCTAIIFEEGAVAGVDVRGGGPASRETELLDPVKNCQAIHCVMLSGGSAFGLAASDGAMQYLEEHGIGYQIAGLTVPLVCGASIFDLTVGKKGVRPDKKMGYEACAAAGEEFRSGNEGAGTGATVGKLRGPEHMMKSGIGSFAVQSGEVKCGAVAVVNALGDIWKDGEIIAGLRTEDGGFENARDLLFDVIEHENTPNRENTTLVCVVTNAGITKDAANKVAQMAHNGLARAIDPVHTSMDGDLAFAVATGKVKANSDALGTLAAYVTERAILDAVENAEDAYGIPAARSMKKEK